MAIQRITLQIQGMTCQACANRIEKVLNKKDFIDSANVNFAGETAQIDYDDLHVQPDGLIEIIAKTGFQATLSRTPANERTDDVSYRRTWAVLALSLPFWVGMSAMMSGLHAWMPPLGLQALLATVVQGYFALPFYRGAVASIRGGAANMDVLVSLGTLSIYGYSLAMWLLGHGHHQVYFEAGVMVIALVSLGKYWEARTKRGSLNALEALLQLTPREVSVYQAGHWVHKPIRQVQISDVLRSVHGGRIAADGEVVSGEGWADESHLTGESRPVYKNIGSQVLAGSLVSGSLDYRADSLGDDTLLGDMAAALAEAQGSKAPIARLADRMAAVFVPTVLVISLLTFLVNGLMLADWSTALVRAVAVLVVACPCALGLATPAAVMAGMGVAVRRGVWFKNAAALERAGSVRAVVLDKTGTLTQGKPDIAAIWTASGIDENELLTVAAAVERHAAHPLAIAIVQSAQARQSAVLSVVSINTVAGEGVVAQLDGVGEVKVGKPEFCGFKLPEDLSADPVWQIASLVAVSVNRQVWGAFALADQLKTDSAAAVQRLQTQKIEVYVLSGDHAATVAHIAAQLDLPPQCALGNQSPRDKSQFIQQLQSQGKTVAMVGDGINDAPALTLADVGFAVRGNTDIAEHSADAVLVKPSINQLTDGLLIARATLQTIRQNLFFAVIYNALGIPLAAVGLLTPVLAGAMMAMSSVSVLANALRLKKRRF